MCRQLKVKADSNAFLDLPPTHSFMLSLVQRYSKRDHQLTEWFIRKIAAAFLSEVRRNFVSTPVTHEATKRTLNTVRISRGDNEHSVEGYLL